MAQIDSAGHTVKEIADTAFAQAKENYLQRTHEAEQLFTFADFKLLCEHVERIYWVAGFGSARKIPLTSWQQMWRSGGD